MEIDNVKINWKPLLEVQKKLFQDLYPDMDIENTFSALERQLSSNLIPSRIIINRNRVKGFAYLTGTDASSGRAHGLVCFPEPDLFNEDALSKLLQWIEQLSSRNSREIMLGNIAGVEVPDSVMSGMGYEILKRQRLLLSDTGKFALKPKWVENSPLREAGLEELDSEKYLDSQFKAYESTSDARFLLPDDRNERMKMLRDILDGSYGDLIYEASRILLDGERIAGAILVCRGRVRNDGTRIPIIIDFFVIPEFRKHGYGSYLIRSSISYLHSAGFNSVELWVTEGNFAENIYRKMGFTSTARPDVAYMKALR